MNRLSENKIKELLPDTLSNMHIVVSDETGSTNADAKRMMESHDRSLLLVAADRQTAGRGRGEKDFFSPETGLYMSIAARMKSAPSDAVGLTAVAAVAAAEAIDSVAHRSSSIKWVNDIYLNGKKVAGILCECQTDDFGSVDFAVIGIGINIVSPKEGFPQGISDRAGTVFDGVPPAEIKNILAARFAERFFYNLSIDREKLAEKYRSRSFLIGRRVDVLSKFGTESALVTGIDENLCLEVLTESGSVKRLSSGEVSLRV